MLKLEEDNKRLKEELKKEREEKLQYQTENMKMKSVMSTASSLFEPYKRSDNDNDKDKNNIIENFKS